MHREVQIPFKPCYTYHMTELMEKALAAIRTWPQDRQDEAAQMLLALDRLGGEPYLASDEELRAIDEGLAQVGRDEYSSDADVKAAFARFRK
jgi:hypothetical protein